MNISLGSLAPWAIADYTIFWMQNGALGEGVFPAVFPKDAQPKIGIPLEISEYQFMVGIAHELHRDPSALENTRENLLQAFDRWAHEYELIRNEFIFELAIKARDEFGRLCAARLFFTGKVLCPDDPRMAMNAVITSLEGYLPRLQLLADGSERIVLSDGDSELDAMLYSTMRDFVFSETINWLPEYLHFVFSAVYLMLGRKRNDAAAIALFTQHCWHSLALDAETRERIIASLAD